LSSNTRKQNVSALSSSSDWKCAGYDGKGKGGRTMMTISRPCPRCNHDKSILSIVWAEDPRAGANTTIREALVRCVHCNKHSIARMMAPDNCHLYGGHIAFHGDAEAAQRGLRCIELLPEPVKNDAPEAVPAQVASAYIDGREILARNKWTPAAGSFRTALDRATKMLWKQHDIAEEMPFKLEKRLKALEQRLSLPKDMLSWADKVRVVGNEMHELDDATEADARDVAHFCEMFLTYTFTLPARVEKFNTRREPNTSPEQAHASARQG
jgi:hypothetical protein